MQRMTFIVPEYPLYSISGVLCLLYIYRFWRSNKRENPTNYTFIGKAFAWGLIASLYFWAGQTSADIITVRNWVRLGNLLLFMVYLLFMSLEIWLEHRYGK